jgi:hypothetical protein
MQIIREELTQIVKEQSAEEEPSEETEDDDALVLKGPKVDPLGDSLAARRLRAIARRKAGDKR